MVRVSGLQSSDQKFELGKAAQTSKASIFQKKGQQANPVLTLRSSQSKAVSRLPVRARVQAS